MTTNQLLALLAALAVGFTACKKDDEEPEETHEHNEVAHNATIRMSFSFIQGENAFTLDSIAHDSLGHALKLDMLKFYIGGGHATNDEEVEVGAFEDARLLVDASTTNDLLLGPIYASHIHEFHLDLGLDSATNHADFATAEAPLNDPAMYLNATDGYKFLVITGHADADGDGTFETAFSYACGTDALLTDAHVHAHHDIVEGETFTAMATVDLLALFTGIDVIAHPNASGGEEVNARLMENLELAIDGVE
ncbi:MAG: hypothetical protein KA791_08350 [Flavobacteriales bacterium]|nr:hypothetical protein [Flavobacteriales bacterium]